jgi:hypothetical protein
MSSSTKWSHLIRIPRIKLRMRSSSVSTAHALPTSSVFIHRNCGSTWWKIQIMNHIFDLLGCSQRTLVLFTDVSRQPMCPNIKGQAVWVAWPLKMRPIRCPETSVTNLNLRCVASRRENIPFTLRRKPEITRIMNRFILPVAYRHFLSLTHKYCVFPSALCSLTCAPAVRHVTNLYT